MNTVTRMTAAFFVFFSLGWAQNLLTLSSATLESDQNRAFLKLTFEKAKDIGAEDVSAIEFEIIFPPEWKAVAGPGPQVMAAGKQAACDFRDPNVGRKSGSIKCSLFEMNMNLIYDGVVAFVFLRIPEDYPAGEHVVQVTSVATTPNGTTLPTKAVPAIITKK